MTYVQQSTCTRCQYWRRREQIAVLQYQQLEYELVAAMRARRPERMTEEANAERLFESEDIASGSLTTKRTCEETQSLGRAEIEKILQRLDSLQTDLTATKTEMQANLEQIRLDLIARLEAPNWTETPSSSTSLLMMDASPLKRSRDFT